MRVMLAATLLLAACTWQLQVRELTGDGGAPPDAPADAAFADDAAERPAPPPPLDPALQLCDGYPTLLTPLDGEAGVVRDAAREQLHLATGASIGLWTTGDVSELFDVNAALAVHVGDSPAALDVGLRAFFATWQEAFGFTLDPLATTFAGATPGGVPAWQVSVGQAGAPKVYLDGATGQILMVVQSCI